MEKKYDIRKFSFFKNSQTYIHDNGISGMIDHLDHGKITDPIQFEPFLEKVKMWYPFRDNGIMNYHNDVKYLQKRYKIQGGFQPLNYYLDEINGKHFSKFPDSTILGWRGPIIETKLLKRLPRYITI